MSKYGLILRHPFLRSKSYLYDLCRAYRPKTVIETGVFAGASTSFILQALNDNEEGHLYSIDLPNQTQPRGGVNLLKGKPTGWLVPERLRKRWTLIIGDSRVKLPELLPQLSELNFFHHDSLHAYEHMMFEFNTIWPKLKKGSILASDDVDSSPPSAFMDFCDQHGLNPILSKTAWGYRGHAIK